MSTGIYSGWTICYSKTRPCDPTRPSSSQLSKSRVRLPGLWRWPGTMGGSHAVPFAMVVLVDSLTSQSELTLPTWVLLRAEICPDRNRHEGSIHSGLRRGLRLPEPFNSI